jgi:hypothetical protein
MSRQSASGYGAPFGTVPTDNINPNAFLKDRLANINTAKAQIERQREMDLARERLTIEFNEIDTNQDGRVTLEELTQFLISKS